MVFDYDWWFGGEFDRQRESARQRCATNRFKDTHAKRRKTAGTPEQFLATLETRTVVYLRDGLSYELRELVDMQTTRYLSFECVSPEEQYRVGAFVVSVPFDEVVRVETFAFHPSERPDDVPAIRGFGGVSPAPTAAGGRPEPVRVGGGAGDGPSREPHHREEATDGVASRSSSA